MQDWALGEVINTGSKITMIVALAIFLIVVFILAALDIQKSGDIDYKWPVAVICTIAGIVIIIVFVSPYFYDVNTNIAPTLAPTISPTRSPTRSPTVAPSSVPTLSICSGKDSPFLYWRNQNYTLTQVKNMLPTNSVVYSYRSTTDGTYISFDVAGRPSTECVKLDMAKVGEIEYGYDNIVSNTKFNQIFNGLNAPSPPLEISPVSFTQGSVPSLPSPKFPTLAPTTAPTITPKPDRTCIDVAGWKDANGNSCSFYNTTTMCNSYGIDPSLATMGSICSGFNTQTECEGYGIRQLCNYDMQNGKCVDKPIVAWQACCGCGGGILTDITLPPTVAPTASPTAAPTAVPTAAPVALQDQVLSIRGLVSLDTSPTPFDMVKLYIYRLTYFENVNMKDAIEEYAYGEPIPVPLGSYPKFNGTVGKFESLPNAVVNTPTVPKYGNFEFATEPVDGVTGVYYLFLLYSCNGGAKKKYPLYTYPSGNISGSPYIYFTEIRIDGTTVKPLFDCLNYDFSCITPGFKENNNFTLTVPPTYTNNMSGMASQCTMKLSLEEMSMGPRFFFPLIIFGLLGLSAADNKDNVSKICPTYYADCIADATCLQTLNERLPPNNNPIGLQSGIDWGVDPPMSELNPEDKSKFGYLNECVLYKFGKNMAEVFDTHDVQNISIKNEKSCDFMKTYYKYCKVTTSDNDKEIMKTMTTDEYDKYIFTKTMLEFYAETVCLLDRIGFKMDFDLNTYVKYLTDNGVPIGTGSESYTIPPEIGDIYYGLHAYDQLTKQCSTNNA